ncbi:MAG: hypothetical protein ACREC8_06285 [Limisphaerales bacterium]
MRFRSQILFVALMLLGILRSAYAEQTNQTLTVHGRLCIYNGTPSYRIWVVGTKRLLGVDQSSDEVPVMPNKLHDLILGDREVFGDFVVEPLTPYKEGEMQMVRVVSASKIVVTEKDKIVLKKDKL